MVRKSLVLAILVAVLAAFGLRTVEAAAPLDAQTMKVALRTETPEENGFIQRVLNLVNAGTLPDSLVMSTFLWAREKPARKFQYFKYGMIVLAERRGIRL
jgi:hypothetical protein